MGRMSELHIEISEMLENGYDNEDISVILGVPLDWVSSVTKDTKFGACQEDQPTL